jgi:hypothetical protein
MSGGTVRHVFFVATVLISCAPAPGADEGSPQPASAAGPPALKRILANWKARRDRVKSLHFIWDVRLTVPKGQQDGADPPNTIVTEDRHYDQHGNELWIEGDDHFCMEEREWPLAPHPKSADKGGTVGRQTFDGELDSRFWASQSAKLIFAPQGWIHRAKEQDNFAGQIVPLLLTYRTLHPWMPWRPEECRLITENAIIGGVRYVKIQRPVDAYGFRGVDICWVDPHRDDVVVSWEMRRDGKRSYPNCRGSCEYQMDKTFGWVPCRWRGVVRVDPDLICESTVTRYEINKKISPEKFAPHFPPGTFVADSANAQWYVVQQDGSKRMLMRDEFRGLTKPVPAADHR